jgi:hypothetical protein
LERPEVNITPLPSDSSRSDENSPDGSIVGVVDCRIGIGSHRSSFWVDYTTCKKSQWWFSFAAVAEWMAEYCFETVKVLPQSNQKVRISLMHLWLWVSHPYRIGCCSWSAVRNEGDKHS